MKELNRDGDIWVSVVIPCFNSEAYIEACLDSIMFDSGLVGYEIICVNDGSTDGTLKLLEQYELQFPNTIRIVDQNNMGQAYSRNRGVSLARGAYIGFVDSDDTVSNGFLKGMFTTAIEGNADLVVCDFVSVMPDGSLDPLNAREYAVDDFCNMKNSSEEECLYIAKMFLEDRLSVSPCNKLIKASLFKRLGLRFPEGLINEDMEFAYDLYTGVESIKRCHDSTYYYHQREGSTTKRADMRVLSNISGKVGSKFKGVLNDELEYFLLKFAVHLTLLRVGSADLRVKLLVLRSISSELRGVRYVSIARYCGLNRKLFVFVLLKLLAIFSGSFSFR